MPITLRELLDASPYLRELEQRHRAWLGPALDDPDAALRRVLDGLPEAAASVDEAGIGTALRVAKQQIALLAAAAETGGLWTTAQSTAALSDLADAALDAGGPVTSLGTQIEKNSASTRVARVDADSGKRGVPAHISEALRERETGSARDRSRGPRQTDALRYGVRAAA